MNHRLAQPAITVDFFLQRYKVYYTTNPDQQLSSWNTMVVDNNQLTTINELTPLSIYTIRVQAFTSVGPGPLSTPVQVKMQQGGKYGRAYLRYRIRFSRNTRSFARPIATSIPQLLFSRPSVVYMRTAAGCSMCAERLKFRWMSLTISNENRKIMSIDNM